MPWWLLLLIVTLTWCLWAYTAILAKAVVERANRVPPDKRSGVSIAPVIPLFPLAFFGAAKIADIFVSPWGTWVVGALHLLLTIVFLAALAHYGIRLRHQPPPP